MQVLHFGQKFCRFTSSSPAVLKCKQYCAKDTYKYGVNLYSTCTQCDFSTMDSDIQHHHKSLDILYSPVLFKH